MKMLQSAGAVIAACLALTGAAIAAELVMVDYRGCVYCQKFNRQVGRSYDQTAAGQVAPLRRVSRLKKWPRDLAAITPAYATPTFILVDNGREIGRFAGYGEAEMFWSRLDGLLTELPGAGAEPPPEDARIVVTALLQPPPIPRMRPDPAEVWQAASPQPVPGPYCQKERCL